MKQASHIIDTWETGLFVGNNRAQTRVTIEADWYLRMTGAAWGSSKRGPYRWFQREDNSQVETELPNIKSVSIDRSIDTDLAQCKIEVYNQWMDRNGAAPELPGQLGKPGYFSWGRGKTDESLARWNQTTNAWEDVLLPDALIRTYQGYGGFNTDGTPMTIAAAVAAGYLTLTGVWLVDTVTLDSGGMLNLDSRDVGKLLAVQQVYPPLTPNSLYPVDFHRWNFTDFDPRFNVRQPITTGRVEERNPSYSTSSADKWFGSNANILGHRGSDSVDGNNDTFALSVGNSSPARPFCTDYWEYDVNGELNEIYLSPWGGNYTMYISIFENGAWQDGGGGAIPYDPSILFATQTPAVDTGASIPFVSQQGVPWESGQWYTLPRVFNAQKVRVTFRNHTQSPWGPWYYRCGIREIKVRVNTVVTSPPADPWVYSIETYNNPSFLNEEGYWCVADDGQVFAFGDARVQAKNNPIAIDAKVCRIRANPDGKGYWLLQWNGRVHSYGSAIHHGDAYNSAYTGFTDIAVTPSGNGYWIAAKNGSLFAFGDATAYSNPVLTTAQKAEINSRFAGDLAGHVIQAICAHPTNGGLWVLHGNGDITCYGGATAFTGVSSADKARVTNFESWTSIRSTPTGNGLYILNGDGKLARLGDALNLGPLGASERYVDPSTIVPGTPSATLYEVFRSLTWDMALAAQGDANGYYFQVGDGQIQVFGAASPLGYPGGPQGQQRSNGNYLDYADIVRWFLGISGFALYNTPAPVSGDNYPVIYGNIENTGAYADSVIDPAEWDKTTPLDCIHKMKNIVGYNFYIDDEGAARFESPNWWSIGNFWENGTPTDYLPEIDERVHLTGYSVAFNDDPLRSEIIISTEDPAETGTGGGSVPNSTTTTTRLVPGTANILRGIVKPAMWVNGVFNNAKEQKIMAELISLHIWFQQRIGQVTAPANPCIQIDDQIRIFERVTAETYVHYVRGISTHHDLDTGEYTMTLTTHWMGNENGWAITADSIPDGLGRVNPVVPTDVQINPGSSRQITVSSALKDWLKRTSSKSVPVAVQNDWNSDVAVTEVAAGAVTTVGDGAAH